MRQVTTVRSRRTTIDQDMQLPADKVREMIGSCAGYYDFVIG
jgi:hypothetical protein